MVLVGIGTFFAQATATGFVSRAATADRAAASGIYLASYFAGGMVGTAVLGQIFERLGWAACVSGIGLSLIAAGVLARALRETQSQSAGMSAGRLVRAITLSPASESFAATQPPIAPAPRTQMFMRVPMG